MNITLQKEYKKQIAGRYSSLRIDELHKLPNHTLLVQEKHNGVFYVTERNGLRIAGELVGDDFIAFDVIDSEWSYMERLSYLVQCEYRGEFRAVETTDCDTHDEIREEFDRIVSAGGEGIIVRDTKSTRIWKIKPTLTVDCAVIGYTTGKDGLKRNLLLGLVADGFYRVIGSVPARGVELELTPANQATLLTSTEGTLYRFVEPTVCVEVSCNEVVTDGVRNHELRWNGDWFDLGIVASGSLVNPVVLRVRDDKTAFGHDVRWEQIAPDMEPEPEPAPPEGTVVSRRVWRKGDAVRKFLLLGYGTHPDFPPYVACWTDYSPKRAKPLDRTVVPFESEHEAISWCDSMAADNKKGWEECSASN